jgi:hypothetical protein
VDEFELEGNEQEQAADNIDELCDALEQAEKENRWIPMGERLPKENVSVYVYSKTDEKSYVASCFYNRGKPHWYTHPQITCFERKTLTHWRPLPEAPKGD